MNLIMAGLDWHRAPIDLRESLSFTRSQVVELNRRLWRDPGVEGCVLLSTCNRTELYLSCGDGAGPDAAALLCAAAGVAYAPLAGSFTAFQGREAARHLMEVAGGLRSQIWGEDQIVTQVKGAIQTAREAGTADSVLETLFRNAAAAGKEMKSRVRLTGVPRSAAQSGVEKLAEALGGLAGRRGLVIGNGEMGRLAAQLLRAAGCAVTITLRSYHHGQTVVPAGCAVVPYEGRYDAMEGMDLVLSATTSPHYTVAAYQLAELARPPRVLADLAIPRDIEPAVGELPGFTLYNVDDLGVSVCRDIPPQAEEIVEKYLSQLEQWENYRSCLPGLERVKQAVTARVLSTDLDGPEARDLVELAVSRAVDLLSGSLRESLTPEDLERAARKIEVHTAARPRWSQPEERPFRFPLFVDLTGKRAVIVGGGAVACRRAGVLVRFGAEVSLIAPRCKSLPQGVRWLQRPYAAGDLAGAELAVSATDDRAVNRAVGEEARALGIPVSVADAPEECTFFFPAVCAGQGIVAGVAGKGDDHARTARAAKAIRSVLEGLE
ncbi:NAD(P)-dependent oxidoreductase [uncultured Flavonifractor sp.]|uniref:NAD(P)-dependent oxidoreductase n=1 Tax=uncultured Flavonifractor sp. TaxID=1193534 RepID=UPI00262011F9|nr:NAD(P)-dependent oxidoreductase [uncultured Flavonifractor sp.]